MLAKVPMMQCLHTVLPQVLAKAPAGQTEQAGVCGSGAKLPGEHIWQKAASTSGEDQPSGQMLHQGSLPGGTGQPAAAGRAQLGS